ncbi:MAG: fibronectin/fibrinogen-binding protein [Firmicutes bacterium HGW-Firmicutes-16]|nr:MAG: fibronectin/fibrinogen-binding protein [Firmicutes bacterium HGW-Firmicutes-16]
MPLDAITVCAIANELRDALIGAKIDKVQQPSRDTLILSIRGNGRNEKLLISVGTGTARVNFQSETFENPQTPPMFCMLLRKHLVGARIAGLIQPNMERMLVFDLDTRDEMGMESKKQLIVELMGRNSNIILTGAEGHIIDCQRRVDGDMSRVRQVAPGMIYRQPPEQEKPDFFSVSVSELDEMLKNAEPEKFADKWLLDTFSGLSPLICREMCYLATQDSSKLIAQFSESEKAAFLDGLIALETRVKDFNFVPTMLIIDEKPYDYSFMPIKQYENTALTVSYTDFSSMLEDFYTKRDKQDQMKRKSQALYKSVKSAHERSVRKLAARFDELRKTENRDTSRKYGDLITANFYRIKKGDRFAEVEDYFEESCPKIQIPLDVLKTPQQNAAKYYKDYTKAKTAEKYLGDLIEKGEREEEYLLSVMDEIQRCESDRDLAEIRRELTETGFIRAQKTGKSEKIKESAPLRFISSAGMEIFVGKNNAQNDKLTTKIAHRTDIWLHVQKLHGSHVIINCDGGEPDEKTLFEAATLAAYYSQGREGGKVPVDYTQVRFVKKPSGSMPGKVNYTDFKTIIVTPDEKLVSGLKKD